jgi:hypothetical protein
MNFTSKEVADILNAVEGRGQTSVQEACAGCGISLPTYYNWRRRFGGMTAAQIEKARKIDLVKRKQQPGACSVEDLVAWEKRLGFTRARAAAALGMALSSYTEMVGGRVKIDMRTALACAAIEKKIKPIGGSK